MKAPLKSIIIGLVGMVIGLAAGRAFIFKNERPSEVASTVHVDLKMKADRSRMKERDKPTDRHNFASLRKSVQKEPASIVRNQMERLSVADLKSLIEEISADPKRGSEARTVLLEAAQELFRREGLESLAWADTFKNATARQGLLKILTGEAATKDYKTALVWIDRLEKEFGKSESRLPLCEAIRGATAGGAEDLLKLKELYGDRLGTLSLPQDGYPEDFDFHQFLTGISKNGYIQTETAQYWAAKDKNAAWSGVKEIMEKQAENSADYFGSIFTGVAAVEGEEKAAQWLFAKLDELPAGMRDQAITSLKMDDKLSKDGVMAVLAALPVEKDRVTFAAGMMWPFRNNGLEMVALNELTSAAKTEALMTSAKTYLPRARSESGGAIRDYFAKLAEQSGASVEDRARLTDLLAPQP